MSYQSVPALDKDWLTPFYDVLLALEVWERHSPGGYSSRHTSRTVNASWMSAVQQPLRVFFALGRLVRTDEARYIEDNKAGKLPRFLQEAGFAVQELPARYKGVQFLLATKDAGAKARRKT